MSGIEITGLVLGTLPILIAALEGYKKGLKPIETFLWKWKKELETLTRCLKHHKLLFRQNMRRLLAAASLLEEAETVEQNDIFIVMQRSDVCDAIAQYLADGECLEFFVEVLEECGTHLKEIASNLQHIQQPRDGKTDLKSVIKANPLRLEGYAFKDRFNFTMKHKEMKRLVEQIDTCNDKLERFLDSVDKINSFKTESQTDRSGAPARFLAASFHKIWNHANTLHSTITTCWPTSCHQSHQAMLFLETRAGAPHKTNKKQDPKFRLLLSADTSPVMKGSWSESEVHVLEISKPTSPTQSEIDNLCSYLSRSNLSDKAYLMELTKERKLFYKPKSDCDAWTTQRSDFKPITLGQYLRGDDNTPLMPKDITMLALTLASSLLQLTQTKWINQTWTKDVIQVFKSKKTSNETIEWAKPLIITSFPPHQLPPPNTGVKDYLLDLGIVLMEIWEQQTFESWLTSIGTSYLDEYYVKMAFAVKWLESVHERWPLLYADAVSACVRFSFEGVAHGWDHPEFRRAVCEKIVAPLQQNCTAWIRVP